jgi:hypothetical protein
MKFPREFTKLASAQEVPRAGSAGVGFTPTQHTRTRARRHTHTALITT